MRRDLLILPEQSGVLREAAKSGGTRRWRTLWLRICLPACLIAVSATTASAQLLHLQGPNFGTYSIGDVEIPLAASGGAGAGTYTWQVIGALPPGVSLRTDMAVWPSWVGNNTSAMLLGIATTPGTYNFTLRVSSGGQFTDQAATLRISSLAVGNLWELRRGFVGKPYSDQLIALSALGPVTWSLNSGLLPPGLTLSPSGVVSGTPTMSYYASFNVRLTDGASTVFRGINLEIHAVEITSPSELPPAINGQPYTTTLTGSGGTPPYTFSSQSLFSGLVLDPTGTISGTLNAGRGFEEFQVTMTDANGISTWKNMAINTLAAPQQAPRVTLYSNFSDDCTIGWVCERGVSGNSGGTAPFTWTISGQPPGMAMAFREYLFPNHMLIGGTPTQAGTFNVQVTVTDAVGLTTTNVFPIRVSPLVQRFDSFRRTELIDGLLDVPYSSQLSIYGGVLPYTVSIVSGQLPPGLSLDPNAMIVSGTPTAAGSFTIEFEYTDAVGQKLRVRDFFVIDGSQRTTSNGGTIFINTFHQLGNANLGSSFTRTLVACCVPSFVWTAIDPLPPGLTLSSSGVLSGIPTTNGSYQFVIRAADAQFPASNWAEQRFFLTVAPATPIIFITNVSLPFGNVGTPYNVAMTSSGGTGALTWTLAANNFLPPGLALATDGTLSGTPTATGQFAFTVNVTDGTLTGSRFYQLFIYPAGSNGPLDISFGPNLGIFGFGSLQFQLTATGGTPPYQYSLTPGANPVPGMRVQSGQPLPLGFSNTSGGFIGILATPGSYSSSLRVTDSTGAILDRPFSMAVSGLHTLSQSPLPRATVGSPYSFTLEPYGAVAYGWSATNLPPGITINSSGQLQGTPTASGSFFATITLTDLATSVSRGFGYTLGVDPFAITTNGELPDGTVGIPYSQTLQAPGCQSCVWTATNIPSGLSLSAGVISGTPTTVTSFTSVSVTATGSNGTVQKQFSISIRSNTPQALSILTTSSQQSNVGGSASVGLFPLGGTPPYTWTLDAGSLPPGVSLDGPGEALSSFTIPGLMYLAGRAMQPGVFNFTMRLTDALAATTTRAFTWNITRLAFGYASLPLTANTLRYNNAYVQTLLGLGGSANYTWTNVNAMPPGLVLDPTGVVSGQPTNTGTFSTQILLTDDAGNANTSNVSFTIVSPTGTTIAFGRGANLGTVAAGSSFSSDLLLSGGTPPYNVTALTPLPPGFTLLSGNSLISGSGSSWFLGGIPLATGTFTFTLEVMDSVGNVGARTFTILVSPLSIVTSTLANAGVGVTYLQPLLASGGNGALTWALATGSTLPSGLTLSAGGVIAGVTAQTGNFSFTVVATDSTGNIATRTLSINVAGLAITDPEILPFLTAGVPYTYTFSATGGVSTPVWSTPGLPSGLTLSPTGMLSGTLTATGSSTITISVTDGVTSFSRRFTIYFVSPIPAVVNVAPLVTSFAELVVGQAASLTLPAGTGGVPPYTWSVAAGSSLPPGLALVGGSLVTPTFLPGQTLLVGAPTQAGTFVFDLVATDTVGMQIVRTFTVNVANISLLSGFRTPIAGVTYAQQLTTVGGTPPYTYTASPVSATIPMLPPGISLSASGLLSGTTTSTGLYQVRVRVVDSAGNSFSRTLGLLIASPTGLLVNVPASKLDVNLGGGRAFTLFASSGGNTITTAAAVWSHVGGTLPPGMGIVPNIPAAGQASFGGVSTVAGTYVFTLRATDPANAANFADREFTVRVVPMQIVSPPVESNWNQLAAAHVGQAYSTTVKMAGGTPPYTFTPTPFSPLPVGLTLSAIGVLSGTPQQVGTYTIGFDVSDSVGNTFTSQQLSLTVTHAGVPRPLVAPVTVANFGQVSVGIDLANNARSALDFLVRGGVLPFSWSVSAGSSLPPGLVILSGGNGVSDVLGGSPTTVGSYTFSLDVLDAAGKTLTFPMTLTVVNLTLGPQLLPHGMVGSPYSITLSSSGGAPPYGPVRLNNPFSDLPPGLTLSNGVLSGTPTMAGNFLVLVLANDSGTTINRFYRVTINNAAGQAPPVSISPKVIQVHHVQGSPVSPVPLMVNTSTGVPFTGVVSGIPGAFLSPTSGTTPASVALNLGLGSLSPGSYNGFVGVAAPSAANLYDIAPVTVTVVAPPPCTYGVNPTAGSVASGFAGGSFSVGTGVNCAWTAIPSASWITVIAGSSGTGPGNVSYLASANPAPTARQGTITVNGAVYSITQFGTSCSFALNPATINAPATGGSALISVTASNAACAWTASGLNATPAGGTGNGSVTVTIPSNGLPGTVVLNATIANQTLTVNESGVGCSVSLGSSVVSMLETGGQSTVQVTAPVGCSYSTVTGPSWITVTSGGSGNGTGSPAPLIFNVAPNSTTVARSGTMAIGGQTFQVDQAGLACSVTIDTSGLGSPYGPAGGVGLIGVATNGANCTWNASSAAAFANVAPQSGAYNGTVAVTVLSNAGSTTGRFTDLTIAGQAVRIQQSGTACTFNLQSADGTVPASGGTGGVGVVAPAVCSWSAVSNNLPWLSVAPGASGSTSVQFVAQANTSANPRIGTLTVAGSTYTVTQAGAPCTYTLSASSLNVASTGTSSSFSFSTAATGCSPVALRFSSWINGLNTTFNGSTGTVDFTVDPTPFTTNRSGTIQLGDKTFTITQLGGSCGYSLAAYGALFGSAGGNGSVIGSPTALGCVPATGTTQPTIISLSPLGPSVNNLFTQDYAVVPFSSLTPAVRRAQITFGGLVFTVKQSSY